MWDTALKNILYHIMSPDYEQARFYLKSCNFSQLIIRQTRSLHTLFAQIWESDNFVQMSNTVTASEDGPPERVRLRRVSVQQESSSRIFKKIIKFSLQ